MNINTDYLLNESNFNLIYLNSLYQLYNTNPLEANLYTNISNIDNFNDSFINPILTSQYNILNLNNSIGYMQTAYKTLNQITPYTNQLLILSNTLETINNPEDKNTILNEMKDLYNQINTYIQNTTYNGVNVFNQEIQIGDSTIKLELPSLDITDSNSIEDFIKHIKLLKEDIEKYLDIASLYSNNFIESLMTEIYPQNQLNLLNKVNLENLKITADMLALAHKQDYLSNIVEQLLL